MVQLANDMQEARRRLGKKLEVPIDKMGATTVLLAAPPVGGVAPRFWQIALGSEPVVTEGLQHPGPWFEGSAGMTFALFTGIEFQRAIALREHLKTDPVAFEQALQSTAHLAAKNRINFWTMPVQDAIDFAVFAAQVQVEMDRFLPGFGSCGGPIDVMTLEMSPKPKIRELLGKSLRHPHSAR